jgi:tetrahydromethanopterin S-methyltransferase subunit A
MVDVENSNNIQSQIQECIINDCGAFEEETLILELQNSPINEKDQKTLENT